MANRFYSSHDVDIPCKSRIYKYVGATAPGESRMHLADAFRSLDVRAMRVRNVHADRACARLAYRCNVHSK